LAYTVLVVESNAEDRSRMALAMIQAASHVQLCLAKDPVEGQNYLSGAARRANHDCYPRPELILLDVDPPSQSSLEFLQWVRAGDYKQTPVIVLASSPESPDINRAYATGANSCLLKSADERVMTDLARGIGAYAVLLKTRQWKPVASPTGT
jgi:two-component system response regulator